MSADIRPRWVRACGASEPPILLALLRIAVAVIALVSPEPDIARIVATRPVALWIAPEGLAWLGTSVPLTPWTVHAASFVLRTSAVMVVAGLFTRSALAILAASLVYVFGAAQLTGTVTHDMHLAWFAALLAATPAGAALSADAWARGAALAGPPGSPASTLGVATARLWLGLVYFFPGLHKLLGAGLAWITTDNLRNQMYFKWYEAGGLAPWPRIDRAPYLLNGAAAAVIAFELAMPALVLFRRTRTVALVLGLSFHLGAAHFMDIHFPSLMACYVILLSGDRMRALAAHLLARARLAQPPPKHMRERPLTGALAVAVAGTFTLAIVVQGVRGQTQSYPFACYPTFEQIAPAEITDLAVDLIEPSGSSTTYRLPRIRRQDEWGFVWRLAGLYGSPVDPERLRAFAGTMVPRELLLRENARLRFMLESYDVRPETYGAEPRARWVLHE